MLTMMLTSLEIIFLKASANKKLKKLNSTTVKILVLYNKNCRNSPFERVNK
jgi:hypothetical protein